MALTMHNTMIKSSNSKGKKLKCSFCKIIMFFVEDDVIQEDGQRIVICENCRKEIKLKRI